MPERVIEAAVRYREESLSAHHQSHGTRLQASVEELRTIAEALSAVVDRSAGQRENGRAVLRERWH